jgi:hypothetical protein
MMPDVLNFTLQTMLDAIEVVGVVVVVNGVWAFFRNFLVEPSRDAVRLLSGRLALALREGSSVQTALSGMRSLVPWPHPRRLAAAERELCSDAPPTLVAALGHNHLLPNALLPLAASAERLGPEVLSGWFGMLAQEPRLQRSLGRRLTPMIVTVLFFLVFAVFFFRFLLPKWDLIFRDLGVHSGLISQLSAIRPYTIWMAIGTTVAIAIVIACWERWRWALEVRHLRGEIVLHAVTNALPESAIVSALSLPVTLTGLREICHAVGWAAQDGDELAILLAADRVRRDRWMAVMMSVMEIIAPMVLAIPVLALATTIFGMLIIILNQVGESL